MFVRRDVLKLTLGCAAGTAALSRSDVGFAQQPGPPAPAPSAPDASKPAAVAEPAVRLGSPVDFQSGTVIETARALAKSPFKPIPTDVPDPFKSLTYDQYTAIHLKPEARIWASESLGFVIEPLHRGFQFSNATTLFIASQGKAYKLVYDVEMFDFGSLGPSPKIGDIGFSGFKAHMPADGGKDPKATREVVSFQGANFFQALADGQVAGILARALALKIGDPKGEEIPAFRSIWIEKPSPVSNTLIVHAIIDSDSIVGAFHFTIRPGEATIIDTECTLFPRVDIGNFGLASMSATHLLGFMDHKSFDDYRPNVSEVCGVQMLTGAEEWVWRPVTNRESLQVSTFADNKPRGFGLLIRNRDFEDYDDPDNHWEKRPSLWIEPLGEWAEGGVQLIEIPSQSDANDNILCFWRPKDWLKAGSETSFAYRQFWCWDPPQRPDLARAMRSRSGAVGKHRRFFVEFEGDILADKDRANGMSPTLTATSGSITMMRTFADPDRKSYRVLFELDPNNADSSELRLQLRAQDKPVSETWLYRWTPA